MQSVTFVSPHIYPLLSKSHLGFSGGAERQFFLFGRKLVESGWRVVFITHIHNKTNDESSAAYAIYHSNFSYLGGPKWRVVYDWWLLWKAMAKANTAYYVLKTSAHLLVPMALFCKIHKRKLVFWSQTSHDSRYTRIGVNVIASRMQNWGIKKSNIIIAQTEEQKRNFLVNYGKYASLVPSMYDSLSTTLSNGNNSWDVNEKVDVLWVGNSMKNKRYEVVFELAKLLPHCTFAVGMIMSDQKRFRQAKKEARYLPNLKFLGTVPSLMMEQWFRKTKILINTSIREGFPNTFLQAWNSGVPVVSLNIDPDNIIRRFNLGRVAATEKVVNCSNDYEVSVRFLAPIVRELLVDSKLRTIIAANAKRYVRSYHSPSVVASMFLSALNS